MIKLPEEYIQQIKDSTGAKSIRSVLPIQELWSGYGKLLRVYLRGAVNHDQVIVKHVTAGSAKQHPRGWSSQLSNQRKLKSYQVETYWYRNYARDVPEEARIPKFIGGSQQRGETIIVLEDLDAQGFARRKHTGGWSDVVVCLQWLAHFHAAFLGRPPQNLWRVGTYWHLATRPDELKKLDDERLKQTASNIDQKLSDCYFKTLVHGDAKLANFFLIKTRAKTFVSRNSLTDL